MHRTNYYTRVTPLEGKAHYCVGEQKPANFAECKSPNASPLVLVRLHSFPRHSSRMLTKLLDKRESVAILTYQLSWIKCSATIFK